MVKIYKSHHVLGRKIWVYVQIKDNYFAQIKEGQLPNSWLAKYASNQHIASLCRDSSLLQAIRGNEKLWFIFQVYLLLPSLRFYTNLGQQFFSYGTNVWSRKCLGKKENKTVVSPLEENWETFPLVLYVQLSGTILESDVNLIVSKHINSFFESWKWKRMWLIKKTIWVNSLTKRKKHSHWLCVYPKLKNTVERLGP